MYTVAVVVGSLRRDSTNRKFANALAKLAQSKLRFTFLELADVPIYNEDLWEDPPASVLRLKRDVETADAVLFVTPEYNRSITPVIKNAIDWGTRPWGRNSWAGKPAAIVGASPGTIGTAAAQAQLRSILPVVDLVPMVQPEVYFVAKPGLIDDNGDVTDDTTREFLEGWIDRFASFIGRVSPREAERRAA